METQEFVSAEQYEQRRKIHSLLLLQEMQLCRNEEERRKLFEQVCDLEASHISEVLEGETRTTFQFDVYEGELFAIQPNGVVDWSSLHENGVKRARAKAQENPRFNFYKDIAEAELEESREQGQMVAAGEPSTMFTLSLDGSDIAANQDLIALGREPTKQKAYFRASVFDGQRLHLYSHSKDGISLEKAKEIYREFLDIQLSEDASSLDILKTRVKMPGAHHDLLDRMLPAANRNNYDFVLSQPDLLKSHIDNLINLSASNLPELELAQHADDLRYDIMSSFKQKLEGSWQDLGNLADSIAYAGDIERMAGTEFAGCDTSLTGEKSLSQTGMVNAYGIEMSSLIRQEFDSKFCPNCLPKPKAGKKVKAWRQGDRIGCYDCGREQDVCTRQIIKRGKQESKAQNTGELIFEGMSSYWNQLKQEVQLKNQLRRQKEIAKKSGTTE